MPKIVKAVDKSGRMFRVSEEEAKARKLTVVSDTNEVSAENKKRTSITRKTK